MTTIPTITEQDVRNLVGYTNFQRGQNYWRDGRIFDTQQAGMTLKAKWEGSSSTSYRVQATFGKTGIAAASCSCPIGGNCKHVVALLLTWLSKPEAFLEQQDIESILQQSNKAELIALIKRMLDREPDLEYLVVTTSKPGTPIDPQIPHKRVEAVFRNEGNEWEGVWEMAEELLKIAEIGDTFIQRHDYANASTVYSAIVSGMVNHYTQYSDQDESGDLDEVITACIYGLKQCLKATPDNGAVREQVLRMLFALYRLDIQAGRVGFADDAADTLRLQATADERRTIAGWVHEAIAQSKQKKPHIIYRSHRFNSFSFEEEVDNIDLSGIGWLGRFLLELEGETLGDVAYLHICQETGLITNEVERWLQLGLIDEAVQATQRASDYDLPHIVDLFVQAKQEAVIEHLIQQRAWKSRNSYLLEWLQKHTSTDNDNEDALAKAMAQFQEQPTFETYKAMRQLATQCGQWETTRPELFALLKTSELDEVLTQIALDEDDTDEIIKIIETTRSPASSSIIRLIEAAEQTEPEAALHFYLRYAAYSISHRNRQGYEQAAHILVRIRSLYEKLGKRESWIRYITKLREQYRFLKTFQNILSASEL
jgi:uncharacterized Zn finger protein